MATMRQIRTRIRVAGNIAQITGAMEMVAAARLKHAQDRVTAARPYVAGMAQMVTDLILCAPPGAEDPLLTGRAIGRIGIVLITADRGLCGSYNSGVIRRAADLIEEVGSDRVALYPIGRKGTAFFRRRGLELEPLPTANTGNLGYAEASATARVLRAAFLSGALDQVMIVYTRFLSAITQQPVVEQLLPIKPPSPGSTNAAASVEMLAEPDTAALTAEVLPRYLTTRIFYAMLESAASEHGARMTSMSSATDNAAKMISTLTLELNRARQAAITKEISEIVSGAEALKS